MSEHLFPSGPWSGFYNYAPGDHHRMGLNLTFAQGNVEGVGHDDVGPFTVRGKYDSQNGECHWTKSYLGAHEVFYRGFCEGKGIWGIWEIGAQSRGGFHIWPQALTETGSSAANTAKKTVVPLTLADRHLRTARPIRRVMGNKPKSRGGRRSSSSSSPASPDQQ
jgi:hypothetical protein